MNRRQFLRTTAIAGAAAVFDLVSARADEGVHWPIGCYNRPWVEKSRGWTYETALEGIKKAGYNITGLLTPFTSEPFIGSTATPEYLDGLKKRIAAHDLKANMGALHLKNNVSVEESIKDVRKQIDNAKLLDLEFLLTFGTNDPRDYADYYHIMSDAAVYAQEHGLKLVLKPHGGGSGAAEEILRCIEQVKQPNFKIWYNAGNIIYYTGKDWNSSSPLFNMSPAFAPRTVRRKGARSGWILARALWIFTPFSANSKRAVSTGR